VSLDAIGNRQGVHRNTVGRRYRQAIHKLRVAMGARGFTHSPPHLPRGWESPSTRPGVAEAPLPRSSAEWEIHLTKLRPAGTWVEGDTDASADDPDDPDDPDESDAAPESRGKAP